MLNNALIGRPLSEIPTPALILNLDALEFNLRKLPLLLAKSGTAYRAHGKGHKNIEIAKRQLGHGAVGICCQKLSEAEVFISGGIDNVLLTNEIVDSQKLTRVCELAKQCNLTMVVDSIVGIVLLETAASRAGIKIKVLVEVNLGQDRCGVSSTGDVIDLASKIRASEHLIFAGLQAYHGKLQHVTGWDARRDAVIASTAKLKEIVGSLHSHRMPPDIVAGGGTGTFEFDCELGVINELQPGSYVVMDSQYNAIGGREGGSFDVFRNALHIATQVISRSGDKWCVVDAGLKTIGSDAGTPRVVGIAAPFSFGGDEHGIIDLRDLSDRPSIGDRLSIVPGHCDTTINLHNHYVVVENERVVDFWKVDARGCVQ
jgi:3-hydroxy-D-aspartate aldolase